MLVPKILLRRVREMLVNHYFDINEKVNDKYSKSYRKCVRDTIDRLSNKVFNDSAIKIVSIEKSSMQEIVIMLRNHQLDITFNVGDEYMPDYKYEVFLLINQLRVEDTYVIKEQIV